ncbi:MAG TPA: hypothetical protein VJH37_04030 [Candidatus Nanoarchaeia archaeon]|nr:hypothetical protein [Candidatus Nanoarchaeia archaeon]
MNFSEEEIQRIKKTQREIHPAELLFMEVHEATLKEPLRLLRICYADNHQRGDDVLLLTITTLLTKFMPNIDATLQFLDATKEKFAELDRIINDVVKEENKI